MFSTHGAVNGTFIRSSPLVSSATSSPSSARPEHQRRHARKRHAHREARGVAFLLPAERLRRVYREVVFVGVIFQQEERVERPVVTDAVAAIEISAFVAAFVQVLYALP